MPKELAPTWEIVDDGSGLPFEQRASDCRKRIEEANRNINVGFYDLAVGLYDAYRYEYIKAWGFETIDDYADEVLGFGRRKAYNLIECGRAILDNPYLTRERIESLGWTKLSLIAGKILLLPDKTQKYLELAESSSYRELKEYLKAEEEEKEDRDAAEGKYVFYLKSAKLDGEDAKIVDAALRSAAETYGIDKYDDIIARICSDWLMMHGDVLDTTLNDWIEFLEKHFDIRLEVRNIEKEVKKVVSASKKTSLAQHERNFLKSITEVIDKDDPADVGDINVVPKEKAYRTDSDSDVMTDEELDALLS